MSSVMTYGAGAAAHLHSMVDQVKQGEGKPAGQPTGQLGQTGELVSGSPPVSSPAIPNGFLPDQPSAKSVMETAHKAVLGLLEANPVGEKGMPWLDELGFTLGQEGFVTVNKLDKLRIWYRNDVHGSKYFASCIIPNTKASETFKRVWKPAGMRHIFCTDDAPATVLTELGPDSRVEFHKVPTAHAMSAFSAKGQQHDYREALLFVMRTTVDLPMDGSRKTKCSIMWMKSARHPSLPSTDQTDGVRPGTPEPKMTESLPVPVGLGESARAVVYLRALAMYEDPTTNQTVACLFGHDNPVGWSNSLGMASYYLTGGNVSGGLFDQVLHNFQRLSDVVSDPAMNQNHSAMNGALTDKSKLGGVTHDPGFTTQGTTPVVGGPQASGAPGAPVPPGPPPRPASGSI